LISDCKFLSPEVVHRNHLNTMESIPAQTET